MSMELPEHLRTGPLADAAAKALQDAASMAASSNSVPRLSLKGREFRLIEGGEEVAKFRDFLNVVILGVEPGAGLMVKTYYKAGYTQGAKEPPTCSSDDGIAPSPWVTDKQATQCKTCPHNQFGSAKSPSGKATKACRDSKRIWFKLATGNLQQQGNQMVEYAEGLKAFNDRTLYGANVTVASLKAFADHGRALAALGQGPAVCVTKMKMLDSEFPQLEFEIAAWLDAETAPQSLKLAAERPWKIQYANAGLALSMNESASGAKAALPMQVPEHLRQQSQNVEHDVARTTGNVQQGQAMPDGRPEPSAGEIDDAVGTW